MPEYLVEVEKYLTTELKVEADNEDEALEKAIQMCKDEPNWILEESAEWDGRVFGH